MEPNTRNQWWLQFLAGLPQGKQLVTDANGVNAPLQVIYEKILWGEIFKFIVQLINVCLCLKRIFFS